MHYFENWTNADVSLLELSIVEEEHVLLITLQDNTLNKMIHFKQPMLLRDFIAQFKHQQKIFSE